MNLCGNLFVRFKYILKIFSPFPRTVGTSGMAQEHMSIFFPDKTVRFTKINNGEDQRETAVYTNGFSDTEWGTLFVKNVSELYIISASKCVFNASEQFSYIQSCLDLHKIFRSSKNNPSFCFGFTNSRLDQNNGYSAGGRYSRILCAAIKGTADLKDLIEMTGDKVNLFRIGVMGENKSKITLNLVDPKNAETISSSWKLITGTANSSTGKSENSEVLKTVFDKVDISPVFHDLQRALNILNMYKDIPEVEELLKIYTDEIGEENIDIGTGTAATNQLKYPFIVVEGLDASGKTTLAASFNEKFGASKYCTPPPVIQHLRKYFTSLPEIMARAYYQIGNYIVAQQIQQECQHRPVILDRFWHSTAAYGIANESSYDDLPEEGHFVYSWPSTLLKPSIVLFLYVTEATRQQRITQRPEELTFEEKALDTDLYFRKRSYECYKRMYEPGCIEIDANGSKQNVLDKVIAVLKEHDINL